MAQAHVGPVKTADLVERNAARMARLKKSLARAEGERAESLRVEITRLRSELVEVASAAQAALDAVSSDD